MDLFKGNGLRHLIYSWTLEPQLPVSSTDAWSPEGLWFLAFLSWPDLIKLSVWHIEKGWYSTEDVLETCPKGLAPKPSLLRGPGISTGIQYHNWNTQQLQNIRKEKSICTEAKSVASERGENSRTRKHSAFCTYLSTDRRQVRNYRKSFHKSSVFIYRWLLKASAFKEALKQRKAYRESANIPVARVEGTMAALSNTGLGSFLTLTNVQHCSGLFSQ